MFIVVLSLSVDIFHAKIGVLEAPFLFISETCVRTGISWHNLIDALFPVSVHAYSFMLCVCYCEAHFT